MPDVLRLARLSLIGLLVLNFVVKSEALATREERATREKGARQPHPRAAQRNQGREPP